MLDLIQELEVRIRLPPAGSLQTFGSWPVRVFVYYSRRYGWLLYEHLVAPTNGAEAITMLTMLEMRRRQGRLIS